MGIIESIEDHIHHGEKPTKIRGLRVIGHQEMNLIFQGQQDRLAKFGPNRPSLPEPSNPKPRLPGETINPTNPDQRKR